MWLGGRAGVVPLVSLVVDLSSGGGVLASLFKYFPLGLGPSCLVSL